MRRGQFSSVQFILAKSLGKPTRHVYRDGGLGSKRGLSPYSPLPQSLTNMPNTHNFTLMTVTLASFRISAESHTCCFFTTLERAAAPFQRAAFPEKKRLQAPCAEAVCPPHSAQAVLPEARSV